MKPDKPCRKCGGKGEVKGKGKGFVPCPVCQGSRNGYATK